MDVLKNLTQNCKIATPGIIEPLLTSVREAGHSPRSSYLEVLFSVNSYWVPGLVLGNVIAIALLLVIPKMWERLQYWVALFSTMALFVFSLGLWACFNHQNTDFQFVYKNTGVQVYNTVLMLGVDNLSLIFIILTTFTFPFCVMSCKEEGRVKKMLFINLLVLELCLVLSFSVLDLFFFCVSFESIIVPMIGIMVLAGKRERRLTAVTYLVLYTLFGSVFLLVGMAQLLWALDTFNYVVLMDFQVREQHDIGLQRSVWLLLLLGFALKVPIFPFHLWLPEAHVEAPTTGSVVLAGLLLKLGSYGILRLLFLFPHSRFFYQTALAAVCLFSVLIASVVAINQQDMKRIVAYSSVAHMNFALLGFFAQNIYGLAGGAFLMVSHGIVSSSLFLMVGMLYWRYGERDIKKFGGLVLIMPMFCTVFGVFVFSNASVPLTVNFVGEFLVLLGVAQSGLSDFFFFLAVVSTFFGLVYSLKFFNQIVFGSLKLPNFSQIKRDLTRNEFLLMAPLVGLTFLFGVAPTALLAVMYFTLQYLLWDTKRDDTWDEFIKTHAFTDKDRRIWMRDHRKEECLTCQQVQYEVIEGVDAEEMEGVVHERTVDLESLREKMALALVRERYGSEWDEARNSTDEVAVKVANYLYKIAIKDVEAPALVLRDMVFSKASKREILQCMDKEYATSLMRPPAGANAPDPYPPWHPFAWEDTSYTYGFGAERDHNGKLILDFESELIGPWQSLYEMFPPEARPDLAKASVAVRYQEMLKKKTESVRFESLEVPNFVVNTKTTAQLQAVAAEPFSNYYSKEMKGDDFEKRMLEYVRDEKTFTREFIDELERRPLSYFTQNLERDLASKAIREYFLGYQWARMPMTQDTADWLGLGTGGREVGRLRPLYFQDPASFDLIWSFVMAREHWLARIINLTVETLYFHPKARYDRWIRLAKHPESFIKLDARVYEELYGIDMFDSRTKSSMHKLYELENEWFLMHICRTPPQTNSMFKYKSEEGYVGVVEMHGGEWWELRNEVFYPPINSQKLKELWAQGGLFQIYF